MKELEITVKVRNNRLKQRRLELGLTQIELAEAAGVHVNTYIRMENMNPKQALIDTRHGCWKWAVNVLRLAEFFDVEPGELFPKAVIEMGVTKAIRKFDGEEMGTLIPETKTKLLSESMNPEEMILHKEELITINDIVEKKLTSQMKRVWQYVCLENFTLEETAQKMGISRERARQLERQIHVKIRYETRYRDMKEQGNIYKKEVVRKNKGEI